MRSRFVRFWFSPQLASVVSPIMTKGVPETSAVPSKKMPPPANPSIRSNLNSSHALSMQGGIPISAFLHATAPKPFFATSVSSFNDAPRGRFSPRSH